MDEARFYPIVLKYLESNGYMTEGLQPDGKNTFDFTRLGRRAQADVIGIRDIGTEYSNEIEIVAVEVKDRKRAKVRHMTQALGYSTFAHRCYLAMPAKFTEEDKNYARKIGVGLLRIVRSKVEEVLPAELKIPNETMMMWFLRRSPWIVRCMLCGCWMHRFEKNLYRHTVENAFGNEKTLYVCSECQDLLTLSESKRSAAHKAWETRRRTG